MREVIDHLLWMSSHDFTLFQPGFQPFHMTITYKWIGQQIPIKMNYSIFKHFKIKMLTKLIRILTDQMNLVQYI